MKGGRAGERGAALVMVLTMLAIMSMLAVTAIDAASMSLRRTANAAGMQQTRWYLIGAESFAVSRLGELSRRAESQRIDQSEWQERAFVFPLDDGMMRVRLRDGDNCFNLNSAAVADESGFRVASPQGMMQLARLLDLVGASPDRIGLASALADWLDSDAQARPSGPEEIVLTGGGVYRPANALMGDVSELRAVRGFDAEIVARLLPYVCVRPTSAPNLINPNTLLVDQAPLLAMALGDLTAEEARALIRDRPRGGWEDLNAFFRHGRLATLELDEAVRAQFSLQTRYFVVLSEVEREAGSETAAALVMSPPGGRAVVMRRLFGVGRGVSLL